MAQKPWPADSLSSSALRDHRQNEDPWHLSTTATPEHHALVEKVDPPLKRALRRIIPPSLRYRIAAWLLDAPVASQLVRRLDPKLRQVGTVDRDTGVVIEGFPRSSNSYARIGFQIANPDVEICSHTHSYRTVTRAVKLEVPAIVLIRDPEEVMASSLQYESSVPPIAAIKQWRKFYRHIARLPQERLILADFTEVIRDLGSVIARCNAALGTSFNLYEKTPENEERIREVLGVLEEAALPDEHRETRSLLPRGTRKQAAPKVLESLSPKEREALASAKAEYKDLRARYATPGQVEAAARASA